MARRVKVPWRQRYQDSKAIAKHTLRLMNAERDLWVFPIAGSLVFVAMMVVMSIAMAAIPKDILFPWLAKGSLAMTAVAIIGGLLAFPLSVAMSLFNAAYAFGLYQRLEGRPVTPGQAMRRAWRHIGAITRFGILTFIVSMVLMILGTILDRLNWIPYVGRITQTLGAYGWAVAAFFVTPVIVVERERRAWAALGRSASIARGQWGKSVAGIVTIGLIFIMPILLIVFPAAALMMVALLMDRLILALIAITVALASLALVFLAMPLIMATQTAYQTALYRYAVTGRISAPFTEATLHDVWAPYRGE